MAAQLAARAIQPTPAVVTRKRPFDNLKPDLYMMAVEPDVPVLDALQHAQMLLDMSMTQVQLLTELQGANREENIGWTSLHLLEAVQAILAASVEEMQEVQP